MATGDWRDWEWDPTLFAGAAPHYERGRLPYAEGLADGFRAALGLDGRGRLLDVGCGPGSVALRLAHLFDEVVGLDADEAMLAEATRLAAARGIANATWVHRRAEDIDHRLGTFRLVTFAQSFHWMDRPAVADLVRQRLQADGFLVHLDGLTPMAQPEAVRRVRVAYLGEDRRAGQSIRNTSPSGEDDVFRAAGFVGPELYWVPDGRVVRRSIDDLIAESLSSSGGAPHLFGDRLDAFLRDVRAELERELPDGYREVRLNDNVLKVWRIREA